MSSEFGNPGYPAPRGVRIHTKGGFVLNANVRFFDVHMDKGVPTPRWVIYLDGGQDQMASIVVDHVEYDYCPPGAILMFAQQPSADGISNTDRIVARSQRAGMDVGFTREVDKTATRIEPK